MHNQEEKKEFQESEGLNDQKRENETDCIEMESEVKIENQKEQEQNKENKNQLKIENKKKAPIFGVNMNPQFMLPKYNWNSENPIDMREEARKLFFGSNAAYYTRYYNKLKKSGKKASWNWSSFLFPSLWFFSRKMYLYGIAASLLLASLMQGSSILLENATNIKANQFMLIWAIFGVVVLVILGMYGNYFYICHMEEKIKYPGEKGLDNQQVAQLNVLRGGVSLNGIITGYFISVLISLIVQEILI